MPTTNLKDHATIERDIKRIARRAKTFTSDLIDLTYEAGRHMWAHGDTAPAMVILLTMREVKGFNPKPLADWYHTACAIKVSVVKDENTGKTSLKARKDRKRADAPDFRGELTAEEAKAQLLAALNDGKIKKNGAGANKKPPTVSNEIEKFLKRVKLLAESEDSFVSGLCARLINVDALEQIAQQAQRAEASHSENELAPAALTSESVAA